MPVVHHSNTKLSIIFQCIWVFFLLLLLLVSLLWKSALILLHKTAALKVHNALRIRLIGNISNSYVKCLQVQELLQSSHALWIWFLFAFVSVRSHRRALRHHTVFFFIKTKGNAENYNMHNNPPSITLWKQIFFGCILFFLVAPCRKQNLLHKEWPALFIASVGTHEH